ncbi:MAG: metallophosphoesterase [Bacteroidetes bacterium]|nr:metallophosphoesterase [Bacteroidota bacterium]
MHSRFLILFFILLAIDFYVFQGVKVLVLHKSVSIQRTVTIIYWSVAILCLSFLLLANIFDWHQWNKSFRTYSFAFIVAVYFSKIFVVLFLLIDDVLRLFRWTGTLIGTTFFNAEKSVAGNGISRYEFITKIGFVIAAIPFASMIYGMLRGPNRYDLRKVKISSPDLPDSFHGLKVLQISDLHVGSFLSPEPLVHAIELILEQKPDIIFFTGDLVNDRHDEALEYYDILNKIQAPLGVFSILGNHDYGDYYQWNSASEKSENLDKLKSFHGKLGWNLMLNEHTYIEKAGEKIGLIGVENWSARGNFSKYGDLKKAVYGFEPKPFNILLSHDPSHWHAEVTGEHSYIDLTLSGHTHGFQFGVEIPGFKWSPVQYMYKEWADLYAEGKQHLYVNRGLGWIGYPGRVGILPEITVFELNKA